jgi:acetyltransferase-like isoleucine patch superfamily enzyme
MAYNSISRLLHLKDTIKLRTRLAGGLFYKFVCRCRGVEFLGKVEFLGRPRVKLYPGTRLVIGKNCRFQSGVADNQMGNSHPCMFILYYKGTTVTIGDNCGFSGVSIGANLSITIGNNVRCGGNTFITDADWHPEDPRSGKPKPTVIGDNAWIGVGVVILKGSRIGRNSVIGAGSIVTGEIPPNVIAAGNPCKVIRPLRDDVIKLLDEVGPYGMPLPDYLS